MLPIIEQTFKYRRNIIENNNTVFLDLLDKFKYLTGVKNVSYNNRFLFKVIYKLIFKLEMEFSLLILKQMINFKQQMKKVMVNLWRHFDISITVNFSDSYLNFETLLEITFKVELNGFIKAMEKLEKKIKIQDSKALGLIETDATVLIFSTIFM
jgi:hypothetical protein